MEQQLAIRVSGVKKRYRLGAIGGRTLQGELQSRWGAGRIPIPAWGRTAA